LDKKLKALGLKNIFSTIWHIKENDKKYKYIKYGDSIFIDDSFTERMEVLEKIKIPVFSVDAIESLII
jgi:hypothetical protein